MAMQFSTWTERWQPNEYTLFRHRMRGVQFIGPDIMRRWDVATALNSIDLNDAIIPEFKIQLVKEGILTPARADVIFAPEDAGGEPPPDSNKPVTEAPIDGNLYARQNAAWAAFVPGAGGDGGGIIGPPGPIGPQGPVGAPGPQGEIGPAGPAGPQGDVGPIGPAGPAGSGTGGLEDAPSDGNVYGRKDSTWSQITGAGGEPGPVGPAGPAGADGKDGKDGKDGAQGPQGDVGPQGSQGPQGPPGTDGAQGPAGQDGAQGVQGLAGAQGPAGVDGAPGTAGLPGMVGPQGVQGPAGTDGTQGAAGPEGAVGPVGPAGAAGPQGIQGPGGPQGVQGEPGAIGPTGMQGTPGVQGPPGDTVTIIGSFSVKAIADLPPSGYVPADWDSPGVPPLGNQMANGQGLLHTPTQTVCLWVGPTLTPSGWVELGNVAGPTGPVGAAGPVGAQGPQGIQGPAGADASPGPTGAAGPVGPQGLQGDVGPVGAQGPAGSAGPAGAQGVPGTAGTPGAQGAQGPAGAQGLQGLQGAQGTAGIQGTQGVQGVPGPTAVSADANNTATLGSDSKIFVPLAPGGSNANPVMDGTAAPGVGTTWSRGDHVHPSDTSREPTITAGTTAQYWRGDKSWQTLNNSAVGLSNVTNVAQVNKAGDTTTGVVNLKGTVAADSAAVGVVGEVISASITSNVALTTNAGINVGSISLTAGDWDVDGQVSFTPSAGPTMLGCGINTVSATVPAANGSGGMSSQILRLAFTSAANQVLNTGRTRINVSTTTTVYLIGTATFASGTVQAQGYISARRRR